MQNNLFSLNNKIILITGSGRGIGEFLAKNIAKQGAIVYRIDNKFSKKSESSNIFDMVCNVSNKQKIKKICDQIYKKHKKIDVLINNVGITKPEKKSQLYSEKNWDETIEVNLSSVFRISQIVIEHMIKNSKGVIINITSLNAEFAFPNNPAYVASKGGLKQLGKALARDWGRYGIRVNNLGPGYIKTEMTKQSFKDKKKKISRQNSTMLKRWGDMQDLLGPCIFLASDASSYITGQDLYVDGGWSANGLHSDE